MANPLSQLDSALLFLQARSLHGLWPALTPPMLLLLPQFIKGDIQSMDLLSFVMLTEQIDTVMHFAAQVGAPWLVFFPQQRCNAAGRECHSKQQLQAAGACRRSSSASPGHHLRCMWPEVLLSMHSSDACGAG